MNKIVHLVFILLFFVVHSQQQLFLEPVSGHKFRYSKIYLPTVDYHVLVPVVGSAFDFVAPDIKTAKPVPINNETTLEICSGTF